MTDRPEEHLSDFAERIAMVTARMGGARVEFDHHELCRSPIVAVGSGFPPREELGKILDRRLEEASAVWAPFGRKFTRASLEPGEMRVFGLAVPAIDLAYYDATNGWTSSPGPL